MNSQTPQPQPEWTVEQLITALNHMRDAWTRAALDLRDIQFGLDTAQRREAIAHANELMNKVKPR
ncbi:MAG: hypothetical protein PHQ58_06805 [Rhodoferax sp.]|uniref:hypothetical protein n=1 Tax=Rhodoferax sp. TaxID=50421 RepID=UPI00262D8AE5|nr:hypothetical protein [Rhodoferax sp.]MDD2880129.1 hypothetical protein [Rhodoferax sp.]